MIGHYLLTLTPEQEHRVLTTRIGHAPYWWNPATNCGCLVGVAEQFAQPDSFGDWQPRHLMIWPVGTIDSTALCPQLSFDALCHRFGDARIANAVRTRILTNQARRALATAPELLEVA